MKNLGGFYWLIFNLLNCCEILASRGRRPNLSWSSKSKTTGFTQSRDHHGNLFAGYLVDGRKNGQGKIIYQNGDSFVGTFKNDVKNGYGVETVHQGQDQSNQNLGSSRRKMKHGKSTRLSKIGDQTDAEISQSNDTIIYRGFYKNNLKNGNFTITFGKDNTIYVGSYTNNVRDKFGKIIWKNQDQYIGEILEIELGSEKLWVMHGQGKFTWHASQSTYFGEYYQGQKHGYGKLTQRSQSMSHDCLYLYEGHFQNDQRSGLGKMTFYKTGNIYHGQWANDTRNGGGNFTWFRQNNFYSGNWKNKKMHGLGKFIFGRTDEVYQGEFENGKIRVPAKFYLCLDCYRKLGLKPVKNQQEYLEQVNSLSQILGKNGKLTGKFLTRKSTEKYTPGLVTFKSLIWRHFKNSSWVEFECMTNFEKCKRL